jgi:hypothetical protein
VTESTVRYAGEPPDAGSVLHFTVDDRYTLGAFASDSGATWQMPFLGWAVVVEDNDPGEHWITGLSPVFLDEAGGRPMALPDVEQLRGGNLLRLVPAEQGGLR